MILLIKQRKKASKRVFKKAWFPMLLKSLQDFNKLSLLKPKVLKAYCWLLKSLQDFNKLSLLKPKVLKAYCWLLKSLQDFNKPFVSLLFPKGKQSETIRNNQGLLKSSIRETNSSMRLRDTCPKRSQAC